MRIGDVNAAWKKVNSINSIVSLLHFHVVSSHWLEESLQREEKLCEDVYTLRPKYMEESDTEESE